MDGVADLLPYHQQRMDRARRRHFPKTPVLKLEKLLSEVSIPTKGLFKFRLEYHHQPTKTELLPYIMRPCNSIRLVDANEVSYRRKYADRSAIRKCLERKGDCDDILMVQNGHILDASYANVALFDGKHWYTPAWPLLQGTRRACLLEKGTIRASVIRERDLPNFQLLRLVNSMLPWEEAPTLDISSVMR